MDIVIVPLCLALLLSVSGLVAAEPTLRPCWKAGDSIFLEYVRTVKDSGRSSEDGSRTLGVLIEVIETSEAGTVFGWRQSPTDFSNLESRDPILAKSVNVLKNVRLEFAFGQDARLLSLRNEAYVLSKLADMDEMIMRKFTSEPLAGSSWRPIQPRDWIASVTADVRTYFAFEGLPLVTDARGVEMPLVRPGPFGIGTLRSIGRITMSWQDPLEIVSTMTNRYDADSMTGVVDDLLQLAGLGSRRELVAAEGPEAEMTDEAEARSNPKLGVPEKLVATRRLSIRSGWSRVDRREFRIVQLSKR